MGTRVFDKVGFENWLRETTQLRELSIEVYSSYVAKIISKTGGDSEKIIRYLNSRHRQKNCYNQVFAIKYYFRFTRQDIPKTLPKLKKKPRKRLGVYKKLSELKQIVAKLKESGSFYYPVSLIQLTTGSRPRETLAYRSTMFIEECDGLTVILDVKGGREGAKFIPKPYSEEIIEILRHRNGEYPFLKGASSSIPKLISNNYRYYHHDLRKACGGMRFSPHDFRRNFGSDYYKQTLDIFKTQLALGHKRTETTIQYLPEFGGADMREAVKTRMGL